MKGSENKLRNFIGEEVKRIFSRKEILTKAKSLREYVTANLQLPRLVPNISFLKTILPKTSTTLKTAFSKIKEYEGQRMFVHIQYHDVKSKKDGRELRFHQTQYWLNNEQEVNVTLLSISDCNIGPPHHGAYYVSTDVFLAEMKQNFQILKERR